MDDSNILYYLVLAGIYIISRVLKKKKPEEETVVHEETTPHAKPVTPKKRPASVEDILKELTQELTPPEDRKPVYEAPKPIREIKPVEIKREVLPDYQRENIEAIRPDEKIDIVPHKQIERKKPVYERTQKFSLEEEENEIVTGIRDLLEEENGPQKAIIMKEIFDRKY